MSGCIIILKFGIVFFIVFSLGSLCVSLASFHWIYYKTTVTRNSVKIPLTYKYGLFETCYYEKLFEVSCSSTNIKVLADIGGKDIKVLLIVSAVFHALTLLAGFLLILLRKVKRYALIFSILAAVSCILSVAGLSVFCWRIDDTNLTDFTYEWSFILCCVSIALTFILIFLPLLVCKLGRNDEVDFHKDENTARKNFYESVANKQSKKINEEVGIYINEEPSLAQPAFTEFNREPHKNPIYESDESDSDNLTDYEIPNEEPRYEATANDIEAKGAVNTVYVEDETAPTGNGTEDEQSDNIKIDGVHAALPERDYVDAAEMTDINDIKEGNPDINEDEESRLGASYEIVGKIILPYDSYDSSEQSTD